MRRRREITPAKAARLKRETEERRSEQRKRWWAAAIVVLIIILMFVGIGILASKLGQSDDHGDGGAGKDGSDSFGNAHHD